MNRTFTTIFTVEIVYSKAKNQALKKINRRLSNHKKKRMKAQIKSLGKLGDPEAELCIVHHTEEITKLKREREAVPEHWCPILVSTRQQIVRCGNCYVSCS